MGAKVQTEAQSGQVFDNQPSRSYWAISLRRLLRKKVGVVSLVIIVLMYGAGVLSPLVTPYDYNDQDLSRAKQVLLANGPVLPVTRDIGSARFFACGALEYCDSDEV